MSVKISTSEEQAKSRAERENSEEWKLTLEYDLRTTDWILTKVRQDHTYARMLYAALCNNDFIRNETFDLLSEKVWGCTWRCAGGIIAHMRETGTYMGWYCGGHEGTVDEVIREDLLRLGWVVKD